MMMSLQTITKQIDIVEERMTEQAVKKEIYKEHKKTLDVIRQMVALFYEKYSVDGVLDLAEVNKYDRLDKLEKAIQSELKQLGNKQIKITRKLLKDIYRESWQRQAYAIERTVNKGEF